MSPGTLSISSFAPNFLLESVIHQPKTRHTKSSTSRYAVRYFRSLASCCSLIPCARQLTRFSNNHSLSQCDASTQNHSTGAGTPCSNGNTSQPVSRHIATKYTNMGTSSRKATRAASIGGRFQHISPISTFPPAGTISAILASMAFDDWEGLACPCRACIDESWPR